MTNASSSAIMSVKGVGFAHLTLEPMSQAHPIVSLRGGRRDRSAPSALPSGLA